MAVGSGSLAGYARVAYEATGLSDFENDNRRAEAVYRDSTQGMSDAAIKLELSQDRLRRTLQKGPAAYREQARAELQVRNAERELRQETDRLHRSQQKQQAGMAGLRRGLVGLAAGYIGAQGIITLTRTSVDAAREEELVMGQTRVAIEALGMSYDSVAPKLQRQINLVQQLGFDDEELAKGFQLLVRSADDVDQAIEQLGLTADVARGRYISYEAAANIVNKANLGMSGGLRRLGLDVDKNASSTELLTALTNAYGRSAEAATDSAAAAADRFSVNVEELQEAIGRGLAPTVADLSERLGEWMSDEQNLERVQKNVTGAVEAGESAVRGLAAALGVVRTVAEPVVGALGGIENTVKLIGIAWVGLKVKAALGFAGTAAASRLTATRMVADAAMAGRAWDVATRPRVLPVSVVGGGGAVGRGGRTGRIGGFLGGLGGPVTWGVLGGLAANSVGDARNAQSHQATMQRLRQAARRGQLDEAEIAAAPGWALSKQEKAELLRLNRAANAPGGPNDAGGMMGPGAITRSNRAVDRRPGRDPDRGGGGGRSMTDILLDIDRNAGTGREIGFRRERLNRIEAQIARMERRKNLNEKQKQVLRGLYSEAASEQAAIDAIIEEGEQKVEAAEQAAAARRQAAAERRAARREAEEKRMDAIQERAARASEARGKLLRGTGGNRANLRRQALKGVDEMVEWAEKKKAGKGGAPSGELTESRARALQFEGYAAINQLFEQYGSTLLSGGDMGQVATQSREQTALMRANLGAIERLTQGTHHPNSRYASTEIAAVMEVGTL